LAIDVEFDEICPAFAVSAPSARVVSCDTDVLTVAVHAPTPASPINTTTSTTIREMLTASIYF